MKKVYLMALVIFGFFLAPSIAFACDSHSKKTSCSKMTVANTEKMDCCKNDPHSKNKNHECCKEKRSCNGKCGHSNCITTSSTQFGIVFREIQFKNNDFAFSKKKQIYFKSNINLSSGFYSLWLIPKISRI